MMSAHPIVIRDAAAFDATAVAALLSELGHPTSVDSIAPRLERVRAGGGAACLAVDEHGNALGFMSLTAYATLHAAGPVGMITAFVVTASARGQGVGRQLVESAKAWAVERECVRLIVTSGEARADAHAFYPACGLTYTGRRFAVTLSAAH